MALLFFDGYSYLNDNVFKLNTAHGATIYGDMTRPLTINLSPNKIFIGFKVVGTYMGNSKYDNSQINYGFRASNINKNIMYFSIRADDGSYSTHSRIFLFDSLLVHGFGGHHAVDGKYIEVELEIHQNSVDYIIFVDNVQVASGTENHNLDLQSAPIIDSQYMAYVYGDDTAELRVDNLYICDSSGDYNNTRLGPCEVLTANPAAAGSHSLFTPSDETKQNYELVNAIPGGETFVGSDQAGTIDTYQNSTISTNDDIRGLKVLMECTKTEAGPREIAAVLKQGSLESYGPDVDIVPVNEDLIKHGLFEKNPFNNQPWTVNDINNTESGFKISS